MNKHLQFAVFRQKHYWLLPLLFLLFQQWTFANPTGPLTTVATFEEGFSTLSDEEDDLLTYCADFRVTNNSGCTAEVWCYMPSGSWVYEGTVSANSSKWFYNALVGATVYVYINNAAVATKYLSSCGNFYVTANSSCGSGGGNGTSCTVAFTNTGCQTAELFWNNNGILVSYGHIAANSTKNQPTYNGHAWVMKVGNTTVGNYTVNCSNPSYSFNSGGCGGGCTYSFTLNNTGCQNVSVVGGGQTAIVAGGTSKTFTGTGSATFIWTWPGGNGNASVNCSTGNASVNSGGCCTNVSNAGSISGNESNCGAFDPGNISSSTNASGGTGGTIKYRWQKKVGSGSWTNISGATGTSYNPPSITQTTQYRRQARREGSGCNNNWITSNVVTKTVETNNLSLVCEARVDNGGWQILNNCTVTICAGQRLELAVNPNGLSSYQWSGPNGFSGAGNADGNILISNAITPSQSGDYTVTVNNNGCTATKTIHVTVVNTSTLVCEANVDNGDWNILNNCAVTLCAGQRLELAVNPNGLSSYQWNGPNGFSGAGNANGNILISSAITPSQSGDYTVTVNNNGCTATKTIHVTVINTPTPQVTVTQPTCTNPQGKIVITNLPNGFWSSLNNSAWTQNKTVYDNLNPGTYQVGIGSNNCDKFVNVTINQPPAGPTVVCEANVNNGGWNLLGNCAVTVCAGDQLKLSVNPNVSTVNWTGPNGFTANNTNDINLGTVAPNEAGDYTATLTQNGCTSTETIHVTVNAKPDLVCEARLNNGGWNILGNCAVTICEGGKLELAANPNGLASYQWSGPNGFSATGNSDGNILVANSIGVNQMGDYTVTATSANGCTATETIHVTVVEAPSASSSKTDATCGQSNGSITFTFLDNPNRTGIEFSIDGGNTWPNAYAVPDNSGSLTIDNLAPGTYDLFVRWGNGDCPKDIADRTINSDGGDVADAGTFTPGAVTSCDTDSFNPPVVTPSAASCTDGSNPNYQWQVKPEINGVWEDIAGATNASYNPPAQGIGSTWYRRRAICPCQTKATTNVFDVHVYNPKPGSISGDQSECGGYDPANISSASPAVDGKGAVEYRWQQKVGNGNWQTIAGATNAGYNPPAIAQTTSYRRQARFAGPQCTQWVTSNVVIKEVVDAPTVGNISKTNAICGENNGSITINFPDNPDRTNIEFSIDGGNTWPNAYNVPDNSGSLTINNLGAGTYEIFARWGNNECPVMVGTKTVDASGAPVVSASKTNPDCGQSNGKITFTFQDDPSRTGIEFSIDGGTSYPYNSPDNAGSFTVNNLPAGTYQLYARWGNNDCPTFVGNRTLNDGSQAPGTACNDGNPNTENDVIQADGCTCVGSDPMMVDLELTKTANKTNVQSGETVLWTISVVNKGPAAAKGVTVRDNFPAGLDFNSASATQGNFNAGTLTWNIGTLAVNQTVTLTINTTVTATSGTIRNFAQVQTASPNDIDSTPGNDNNQTANEDDEDDATINVQPPATVDLELTKTANKTNVQTGETVLWTISVVNKGPATATGVTVRDNFPAGLDFNSANASQGNFNAGTLTWNIGTLAVNQTVTLTINTTVTATSGTIRNFAQVQTASPNDIDSTPGNDNNQTANEDDEDDATINVQPADPCAGQGGDSDGDGVCDNDDCQPNNPAFPATPGTACNDGNPNTTNDVVQADGCSCAGTPTGGDPDCETDITITTGNGKITVTGLDGAPVSSLQIFSSTWQQVFSCFANCGATEMVDVPAGTYYVYAKYYTAGYSLICEKQATVTVGGGGCPDADNDGTCDADDCQPHNPAFPATPGTACNDGNPNTTNDVVTADGCGCQGTVVNNPCANQGGDSDGDGVCNDQDCQPFDPAFPATPGTACIDGNPNTTNDVVTADGCGCQGTPTGGDPDCEADITITTGNGTITVSGLDGAPISSLQVFTATWQQEFSCFANCNATETISVAAGTYLVYAKYYTAGYSLICEKQATVTVGGGGNCINVTNAGTIGFGSSCSGATDYCPNQGTAPRIKNCVAPSGGAGTLEVIWLESTTSCGYPTTTITEIEQGLDPHWSIIPGATELFYDPGTPGQQTCYLRCVRRAGCPNYVESNIVTLGISANCGGNTGGGTPDCANIGISTGAGSITVTGLDGAPVVSVQIFSATWQPEHNCFANCDSPTATYSVTAGAHYVYVKYYTAQYQLICEVNEMVNVSQYLAVLGTSFSFEAVKHQEHVELVWVHNGDYLVDEYILERSPDGQTFDEIYSAASEKDVSADLYEGYDLEPHTGKNHYRVKMLNEDGTVSYSDVKVVEYLDLLDFVLFPNPANEFTNINLESIVGFEDVDIHIFNSAGVRMKQFHLDEVWSKYYQMDLRDLHEGHYAVWVNIQGRRPRTVQLVIGRL